MSDGLTAADTEQLKAMAARRAQALREQRVAEAEMRYDLTREVLRTICAPVNWLGLDPVLRVKAAGDIAGTAILIADATMEALDARSERAERS